MKAIVGYHGVCREAQLATLERHLSSPVVGPDPIFLTGPASTGKTLIVRHALENYDGGVYVNLDCVQCCTSPSLFRMLSKKLTRALKDQRKTSSKNVLVKYRGVTNASNFMSYMKDILPGDVRVWIVLDNVDRVCRQGVLPVLDRVSEVLGVDIGLILLSQFPWTSGMFTERYSRGSTCIREPTVVEFPAYSEEELKKICLARGYSPRCQSYTAYFEQFLSLVVPAVARMSNNILDVQAVVTKLWPRYIAPVKKGAAMRARDLSGLVTGPLKDIISEMDIGINRCQSDLDPSKDTLQSKVLFAVPHMGKWILLASYIASRNKPTTDKAVFDPGYSRKRRKNSQALDRQVERALEMKLQGSHPFPLERMMNIFYYICEPGQQKDQTTEKFREIWCFKLQHVDISMQVTSLCTLGLLTCIGVDPLTSPMYRCNVSEELAYLIARNLQVSLNDYLKLA